MFFKLFLLFTIVPAVELAILVYAGSRIGIAETISIVIFTALAGSFLVRREGIGVVFRIQNELSTGSFPAESLLDGAMVLVSGALLLTPGFITDIIGFLFVIPATRNVLKKFIGLYIQKYIERMNSNISQPPL